MDCPIIYLEYLKVLVWPVFSLIVLYAFHSAFSKVILRLKNVTLPGVDLSFQEAIDQAKQLKKDVIAAPKTEKEKQRASSNQITQKGANQRMLDLCLQPSPSSLDVDYYRRLAHEDPNLAMAGLRIELEIMGQNLAVGFEITLSDSDKSVLGVFKKLRDSDSITNLQFDLAGKVIELCDAAIHGQIVTYRQAVAVLDTAEILADYYLQWLSWGFEKSK